MLIKLENIKFKDYLFHPKRDEYEKYFQYAKIEGMDIYGIGSFLDLPFGLVKDIQEYVNYSGITWENYLQWLLDVKSIPNQKVFDTCILEVKMSLQFCCDEIYSINKMESENLGHTPDSKELMAGIEVFSKYRAFIQFDSLAGGDITKFEAIRRITYADCYAKLMLDADTRQFNQNFLNLK